MSNFPFLEIPGETAVPPFSFVSDELAWFLEMKQLSIPGNF